MNNVQSVASEENVVSPTEKKIVVGFWLRLVSDIVDALLLGVVGFVLALPLKDQFMKLGPHGIWVGLCIVFLYTGILQSTIGQGQTLGKRLLNIQVLTTNGEFMSLSWSFLRYAVLALIFYNSWIYVALPFLNRYPMFDVLYSGVIVALIVGCVFMVAFHPAKRGIHDLLAGTVVIRKGMFNKASIDELLNDKQGIRKANLIVAGVLSVSLVGFGLLQYTTANTDILASVTQVRDQIVSETGLQTVGVTLSWDLSGGRKVKRIVVTAFVDPDQTKIITDLKRAIRPAIKNAAENYPDLKKIDNITLQEVTGFNIGIAESHSVRDHRLF